MTTVELLQQIGLNKYEAEAYYTLLTRGPLTGYEVGKHSHVPLSRSYEVLEKLTEKGLALIQPGDPPRYTAQEPREFLAQVRSSMETTLSALSASIATLARSATMDEFWVVRGRQNVLGRAQTIIAGARTTIALTASAACQEALADALALARTRGCRIQQYASAESKLLASEAILLLCDEREALVGTITPATSCQAVVSANTALLSALHGYFLQQSLTGIPATLPAVPSNGSHDNDWLAWEERKQRHLWKAISSHRVA